MTGIDLNRAGTPLLEIVSEPEMRSAAEAVAYAKALYSLVTWIGICDGNMQEGSFRCDVNVSVRPEGQKEFGTRREIKNLNSFRFIEQAVKSEVRWQIETIEDGGTIQQATVLFDPDTGETRMMRSKEDAHDYRYFPDPDLPPLVISEEWIERVRSELPELPGAMKARFESQYSIPAYDAGTLTASKALAAYYEATVAAGADAKLSANWIMGDVSATLNREEKRHQRVPGFGSCAGGADQAGAGQHHQQQDGQRRAAQDVGNRRCRRCHHRTRRPEAGNRHRRHRSHHRWRVGCQCGHG